MGKKKLGFSPSKSEFIMLCFLLFVAVVALMLNYLVFPAYNSFKQEKNSYELQMSQLDHLKREYDALDTYKENEAGIDGDLSALNSLIPPYFSQEEMTARLSEAAELSGLKLISISFGEMLSEDKAAFLAAVTRAGDLQNADQAENAAAEPAGESLVTHERITLNFTGTYAAYQAFLSGFELGERKTYFRDITMARDKEGLLNGTMTLLVFSVGLPQEEYPGYDYAAPQAPGAEDPFAPYENYEGPENTQSGTAEAPDFYIILNTYDDNDNKIQIGRYPISATQIASDLNESVSASLDVSGAGDTLSYSYTLGGSSYSGTFDRTGEEILITILSRERKSAEDLVGITLDVSNSTGKTVRITVKNDDPDAPRFVLGTTSGSVTIG